MKTSEQTGPVMGLQNWFSRVLMSTWFREISVIDIENLPSDRGSIIVSWHPGGLFDKMLTKGLIPGKYVHFDGTLNDEGELNDIATKVASGGHVVIFPEGDSHDSSTTQQIRDCAAKIALRASELADEIKPVIIPVGIHYSRKSYFRAKVALTIERPIEINGSVKDLSKIISGEISRSSHSRDNWQDRELIWKARSIILAERLRNNPELEQKLSYGQDVGGARRVRAVWEWLAREDPERCSKLVDRTRGHMSLLDSFSLKPSYVDSRPQSVTTKGFLISIWWLLFTWSFMVGFVTLSAVIGSMPPFLIVITADRLFGPRLKESSRGALKLYMSFIVYPIWWSISALAFTWALLSEASPIAKFADYSLTLELLFSIPPIVVFPLMLWWMPVSGKLQVKLSSRATIAWRRMKLWKMWRDPSFDWDNLRKQQIELASDLVEIGDNLILPGDEDWIQPAAGMDDYTAVSIRE